jgi:cyanophycin synthetase
VLTMPGDRRDEDIAEVAGLAAGLFDHYILKRDDHPRGRSHDEVPRLIEAGLLRHGVGPERISLIVDEQQAVQAALEMAQPNDLLLVFGDNITRCWKQIIYFGRDPAGIAATAAAALPETAPPDDLPSLGDFGQLPEGAQLIRDERGVRLAREPEEAD